MNQTMRWMVVCVLATVLAGCPQAGGPSFDRPADLSKFAGYAGKNPNTADTFRFVVMSDRTGGRQVGRWAQAIQEVNRLKPDMVLCIGDLTQGYTADKKQLGQWWDEFDQELSGLEAPFFYCPGNHDVQDPAPREMYTKLHAVGGRTYYSFNYRNCHFVILDSTLWAYSKVPANPAAAKAQLDWFRDDLAAARSARHTFVFAHHPLFAYPVWKDLLGILDKDRTTIFSGHTHSMRYGVVDGVEYHILGPTATRGNPLEFDDATFHQFAFVTVDTGKPTVAIAPLGQIRPYDWIDSEVENVLEGAMKEMTLSPVAASGGKSTLRITNNSDREAEYTIAWAGIEKWFANAAPVSQTVRLAPKATAALDYDVAAAPEGLASPRVDVRFEATVKGARHFGSRTFQLLVTREMTAKGLSPTIDGKLDDWAGVHAVPLLAANRAAGESPSKNGGSVMLAYDDKNLYVAVQMRDDKLITQGEEAWLRDGVEVFWDPRAADEKNIKFEKPCRQLLLPLPAEGKAMEVLTNPVDKALAKAVTARMTRTTDGYVLEMAIPLASIEKDFVAAPGKTLRVDVATNDLEEAGSGANAIRSLSGIAGASRGTGFYTIVKFE